MTEIDKLIEDLGKEITQSEDDAYREDALLRLQHIALAYHGADKVISSHDLWEEVKNRPEEPKMHTGFKGLDKILDGFRPKQLVILSGITKHGKTTFAIELSVRLKEQKPLWLTFEEPAEDIIQKFVERNEEIPLFFTPQRNELYDLGWIEKKIIESIAKFGSKIVFIDHLGFVVRREYQESQEQATARTVRAFKTMAKKWNVVIVLLCHLVKIEIDTHPNLEDLKDSSAIAQEADTVMFLWRATKKKRKTKEVVITNAAYLSVQANRRTGRTGYIKLYFMDGRYEEKNWDEDMIFESQNIGDDW